MKSPRTSAKLVRGHSEWGPSRTGAFELPVRPRIVRLDLQTGRRQLRLELMAPDRAGVAKIEDVAIAPNGCDYTYSDEHTPSDLYLVEGLK